MNTHLKFLKYIEEDNLKRKQQNALDKTLQKEHDENKCAGSGHCPLCINEDFHNWLICPNGIIGT